VVVYILRLLVLLFSTTIRIVKIIITIFSITMIIISTSSVEEVIRKVDTREGVTVKIIEIVVAVIGTHTPTTSTTAPSKRIRQGKWILVPVVLERVFCEIHVFHGTLDLVFISIADSRVVLAL